MIKDRRISNPSHVRLLLQEQINLLRKNTELDKARAIGYLSNILLSAYKDGELTDKMNKILEQLDIKK